MPTTSRAPPSIPSTSASRSSPYFCWSSSITQTPAIADGTLPTASQKASPLWTVPSFRCFQPPTVLVTAA